MRGSSSKWEAVSHFKEKNDRKHVEGYMRRILPRRRSPYYCGFLIYCCRGGWCLLISAHWLGNSLGREEGERKEEIIV